MLGKIKFHSLSGTCFGQLMLGKVHSVYSWGPLLQPAEFSRVLKHLVPGLRFHAEPQIWERLNH